MGRVVTGLRAVEANFAGADVQRMVCADAHCSRFFQFTFAPQLPKASQALIAPVFILHGAVHVVCSVPTA